MERRESFCPGVMVWVLVGVLCGVTLAQYGGGAGTADDPYLIYTAEQMNAIGADPNDWHKHFKLMADIDVAEYAGTPFNRIGYPHSHRRGRPGSPPSPPPFTGVFDGNGYAISNLSLASEGTSYAGLFSYIEDPNAAVRNLGLIDPEIDAGNGSYVGALVGRVGDGTITDCYVTGGTVVGGDYVGGLVGGTDDVWREGSSRVVGCYSTCDVVGVSYVGGLAGEAEGAVTDCYATGVVRGDAYVGGLLGYGYWATCSYANGIVSGDNNVGGLAGGGYRMANCYALGIVVGVERVGGLAGGAAEVTNCYAATVVRGTSQTGGLVGGESRRSWEGSINSFWDVQKSRQESSAGGTGRTTADMRALGTFLAWGEGDSAGVWTIDEGNDYPRLAWENQPGTVIASLEFSDLLVGSGTQDDPFLVYTAGELDLVGQFPEQWDRHYRLMADIDLSSYRGTEFHPIGRHWDSPFEGFFDGNGHTISNFTYDSDKGGCVGLFPYVRETYKLREREDFVLWQSGVIRNLGLVDVDVNAREGRCVGALVGELDGGEMTNCYVQGGIVSGASDFQSFTGGLVGLCQESSIIACYASTVVIGGDVGGLVGYCKQAAIRNCYAIETVVGDHNVGGLIGQDFWSTVTNCYAAGAVAGLGSTGGLIGYKDAGETVASFWYVDVSGQATSAGGTGLTTAEMMTAGAFLAAGWDFVGEVENGAEDVWWILEGEDYPRLWWEASEDE
ncbi:MAG: GLUG motif-containing protein [Planctomycetota bacterium]|jgi:hypothetical protein